jgi:hypothetical protein
MASGSGISAEQIAHSRLTKVFKFLKELDELRNPVQRDTSSYPAVLKIDEWPVHPCIEIRRGDPTADEGLNESADEAEMVPWRASGSRLLLPFWLALKAEALHLSGRTCEALEALKDAETLIGRSDEPWWCANLHRLRGVFLAAIGNDEAQIEASFCRAIRIAREQKSISLTKRAEESYAEYRRQMSFSVKSHSKAFRNRFFI